MVTNEFNIISKINKLRYERCMTWLAFSLFYEVR